MMYNVMTQNGLFKDTNFALILVFANNAGMLKNLVLISKDSDIYNKLEIDNNEILICDRTKSYLSSKLELVKIKDADIFMEYLDYVKTVDVNGNVLKSNCCNADVKENTDLCSRCKEHSLVESNLTNTDNSISKLKSGWKELDGKLKAGFKKGEINCLTATEIPLTKTERLKYLEDIRKYQNILLKVENVFEDSKIHTPEEVLYRYNQLLKKLGYMLITTNGLFVESEVVHHGKKYNTLVPINNYDRFSKSEHLIQFFIIKDEDYYCMGYDREIPLKLYVPQRKIGLVIGNGGAKINKVKDQINNNSINWFVPYIKVEAVEDSKTIGNMELRQDNFNKYLLNLLNTETI